MGRFSEVAVGRLRVCVGVLRSCCCWFEGWKRWDCFIDLRGAWGLAVLVLAGLFCFTTGSIWVLFACLLCFAFGVTAVATVFSLSLSLSIYLSPSLNVFSPFPLEKAGRGSFARGSRLSGTG